MKKILLGLLLFLSAACQKKGETPRADVLVSIPPYAYFVERIAAGTLIIQTLLPEEANPHLYEPTPKQTLKASEARIWFRLGDPQDKKILKVLKEKNHEMIDVDLCYGIPLIAMHDEMCEEDHHEGKDRHVWMSPKLASYQVKKIAKTLIELYPENKVFYLENTKTLLADLDNLSSELRDQLAPFQGEAILVSHPAFAYFCRDFKMLQLALECEGKEPRPQDLAKILKLTKEYPVRCVFVQAQYNNKGAEVIAKNLHLPVFLVDPYAENYIENLRTISSLIAQ